MIRFLAPIACAVAFAFAVPAGAAARNYSVGNFDRLRVDGPFRVILTTGQPPSATAEGDPRATDGLAIRVEGSTLVIRAGLNGWGEQPMARAAGAPVIRVSTAMLRSAAMIGGGDVTIQGPLRGQRIELTMTGAGSLTALGIEADQFSATAVGSGSMTLGGRAARVRLASDGPVRMLAARLIANDLSLRATGNGETEAQARNTASISNAGLGSVTVYGKPACTTVGAPAGPVSCGKLTSPELPRP